MIVYGLKRGLEVARTRQELSFKSGSVLHVDVPLDACQPRATSGRFAAARGADGRRPRCGRARCPAPTPRRRATSPSPPRLAPRRATPSLRAASARWSAARPMRRRRRCARIVVADSTATAAAIWSSSATARRSRPGATPATAASRSMTMVGAAGPLAAAAGDVDGDGTVDLVAVAGTSRAGLAQRRRRPLPRRIGRARRGADRRHRRRARRPRRRRQPRSRRRPGQRHGRRRARLLERQSGQRPLHLHAGARCRPSPRARARSPSPIIDNDGDLDVVHRDRPPARCACTSIVATRSSTIDRSRSCPIR